MAFKELLEQIPFLTIDEEYEVFKEIIGNTSLDNRERMEAYVVDEFIKDQECEPADKNSDYLQQLNTLIAAHFGSPQMDNSHLLDKRKAMHLIIKLNNQMRESE